MSTTTTSPGPQAGSSQFGVELQALAQVPQMLDQVRHGVNGLRALASVPAAAGATGSVAGPAIATLGATLLWFLAEVVESIGGDIEDLQRTRQNYEQLEVDGTAAVLSVEEQMARGGPALRPALPDQTIACGVRTELRREAAELEGSAAERARLVGWAGDHVQAGLAGAGAALGGVGRGLRDLADSVPLVGDDLADGVDDAVRFGQGLLGGASARIEGIEDGADCAAAAARVRADGYRAMADVDSGCDTTGGN